jgi:hypothetical protein
LLDEAEEWNIQPYSDCFGFVCSRTDHCSALAYAYSQVCLEEFCQLWDEVNDFRLEAACGFPEKRFSRAKAQRRKALPRF